MYFTLYKAHQNDAFDMRDTNLKTTLKKKMDALARQRGAAKPGSYTTEARVAPGTAAAFSGDRSGSAAAVVGRIVRLVRLFPPLGAAALLRVAALWVQFPSWEFLPSESVCDRCRGRLC